MITKEESLKFLNAKTKEICVEYSNRRNNQILLFCLGLIQRIFHQTNSSVSFFKENSIIIEHDFVAGISMRALLLDALIMIHLQSKINESLLSNSSEGDKKEVINKFSNMILSDGLKHTLNHVQSARKTGILTEMQMSKSFIKIVKKYSHFFEEYDEPGSKPILKEQKYYSPAGHFNGIAVGNHFPKGLLYMLYTAYSYFSKYDHFGIIYFDVMNESREQKNKIYYFSIAVIFNHLLDSLELMNFIESNPKILIMLDEVNLFFKEVLESE